MSYKSLYCILLLVFAGHTQQIRVIDFWTEMPLAGVIISSGKDSLVTAPDGLADLSEFSTTISEVIFQKSGYYEKTTRLPLATKIVRLIPVENSTEIEVVSGSLGNPALMTPTHVTLLKGASLHDGGLRTLDQLLNEQAGVFIKSYGAAGQLQGISLRGMSAEQTQLFVDGIPVNNMQLGTADPGQYDLKRFEQVEIYRGGNPRLGGSGTIGGAINLKSRTLPDSLAYALGLRWQSLRNRFADLWVTAPVGGLKNALTVGLEEGENSYSVKKDGKEIPLRNRDFSIGRLRYRFSADMGSGLSVSGFIDSYRHKGGAPAEFRNEQTEQNNRARLAYNNTLSALAAQYFATGLTAETRVYVRNDWNEYSDPGLIYAGDSIASLHFNHEEGLIAEGRYLVDKALFLHGGFEASRQSVRSTDSGRHRRERVSAFLKAEYEWPDKMWRSWRLQLYGSLRGESYTDRKNIVLPGAGITLYRPGLKIYVSAGKNFRVPTFNELYWQPGGNPALKPENSLNLEMGTEMRSTRAGWVWQGNAAFYINRVDNQIVWTPVTSTFWSPRNVLKINSAGVELQGRVVDAKDRFSFSGAYRYGKSLKTGSTIREDPTIGNLVPYLPIQTWNLTASLHLPKLQSGVSASGSSYRYLSFSNDPYDMLPSYWLARCWVGYGFDLAGHHVPVTLAIENLLDVAYQVMPGRPMPGRIFDISIKLVH